MTLEQRAAANHTAAATHHIYARQFHLVAARHYQIGSDYAHAAYQALIAHGHTLRAMDHLQQAIDGELYEVNTMYPEFIAEAEAQKNKAARRTFRFAIEAEKGHAQLFTDALQAIKNGEGKKELAEKATYYVCPECGYTADKADFDRCPVCGHLKEEFELIS